MHWLAVLLMFDNVLPKKNYLLQLINYKCIYSIHFAIISTAAMGAIENK